MGHHPFVDHRRFRPATLADRPRNLAIGHPDDYDLAANFEARKYGYSLSDEADLQLLWETLSALFTLSIS